MEAAFCENHTFELAEDLCGSCGRAYCPECILYAYGPKKPPICRRCAIARAGIRKHAAPTPAASKRELRRLSRERRREVRSDKRAKAEPVATVTATMDWDAIEEESARPVAEPYREPEKVGAARSGTAVGPGLGFDVDEQQLREIRPSFNSDRPYDLPYAED